MERQDFFTPHRRALKQHKKWATHSCSATHCCQVESQLHSTDPHKYTHTHAHTLTRTHSHVHTHTPTRTYTYAASVFLVLKASKKLNPALSRTYFVCGIVDFAWFHISFFSLPLRLNAKYEMFVCQL